MDLCERHQIGISAFVDGEASREETAAFLDHLVCCADCRRFYHDARALSGLCTDVLAPATTIPAPTPTRHRPRWLAPVPAWAWSAAAVVVIAIGVYGAGEWRDQRVAAALRSGKPIAVTLGEAPGRMTDARFVGLALELLRADVRYRREMATILETVEQQQANGEELVTARSFEPRQSAKERSHS